MEQVYNVVPFAAAYGKRPSLTTLVKERFSDELFAEIDHYCRCQKVRMRPVSVRKVVAKQYEIEGGYLYVDTTVNCVKEEDGLEKPIIMIVDAYFRMDENFETIHTRCACPVRDSYRPKSILPDDLILTISKKELDSVAVRMVNALYPRASSYAVPISISQAVRSLGLTVKDVRFDADGEVLGKIFFEDASTVITDPITGGISIIPVTAGTIFVNTPATGIPDERIRNNTILHECVHWMLHRPAFMLAKLWNHEYSTVACRRPGQSVNREWTAIDRMEWQANSLAPRILMPDWATRFIADGWLRRYQRLSPILKAERTIDQLSRHFNVSRQLAKIRMAELGYEDAKDAFSYYDKRKHTISFENATRELARNKSFRDTLASGIYAFVDNCFVIRDRKYIYRDESDTLHLTPYAKAHMAECCLAFAVRRINRGMQYGMLRYNVEDETFITGSALSTVEFAKRSKTVSSILQELPASFSETLIAHMKRKGITVEQLAENCLVHPNTITRLRRNTNVSVSLRTVVNLCIGMRLHPMLSMDLVRKAGFCFNTSLEHTAYQNLLYCMTNSSIYECNEYLSQLRIAPLGKEE